MNLDLDAVIILVTVIGIVLIVFAIGLRSRLENPLLLLHQPALGLRAMAADPAFPVATGCRGGAVGFGGLAHAAALGEDWVQDRRAR